MSEKTIESASAELINTINEAIKSGVEELPKAATMSLDAISALYAADFHVSLMAFGLGWFFIISVLALAFIGGGKDWDGDKPQDIVKIAYSIGAFMMGTIAIICGAAAIAANYSAYVSPLGRILVDKL